MFDGWRLLAPGTLYTVGARLKGHVEHGTVVQPSIWQVWKEPRKKLWENRGKCLQRRGELQRNHSNQRGNQLEISIVTETMEVPHLHRNHGIGNVR